MRAYSATGPCPPLAVATREQAHLERLADALGVTVAVLRDRAKREVERARLARRWRRQDLRASRAS